MLRMPVDVKRVVGGKKKKNGKKKKEAQLPITKARMQVRVVGLAALVSVLFAILTFKMWHLQILTAEEYQNFAQATQTRSVKVAAQRGVIYDRNGTILANNQPGLSVTIVPDAIERGKLAELADLLNADQKTILSRYDAAIASGDRYGPMLVKENATREDIVYVSERTEEYPGLVVNDDYIRNYPNGELAAHVVGYTGAVNQEELDSGGLFSGVDQDAVVGKGGVELSYEPELRGEAGKKEYEVDALGRQVALRTAEGKRYDGEGEGIPELGRPARTTDPTPGKDLTLSLDLGLQKTVEKELEAAMQRAREEGGTSGTGGAALALDAKSGQVLAMSSRPDFDPQMFVGGIIGEEEVRRYEQLNSEEAGAPFTDRSTYGAYPAASTFKPFTGLAGLQSGAIGPATTVSDTGACWRPTGTSWGCWQSWRENSPKYQYLGPHGTQNYAQALMDSNDKFFYQVADWMWNRTDNQDALPEYLQQFGFGQRTGVDLPGESAGRVPTREWQEQTGATEDDKMWTVGRWVNMAIGQGDLLTTPLQLARGYAAIANGGTLVTPHVGKELRDQDRTMDEKVAPEPMGNLGVDPSYLQETLRGLRMVVGPGGTAENAFAGTSLKAVGKSGTGERWGRDQINWFVGWDESRSDPVVVVVMIEGGGAFEQGSELTAAPAVRNILESYYGTGGGGSSSSSSSSSSSRTAGSTAAGGVSTAGASGGRPGG